MENWTLTHKKGSNRKRRQILKRHKTYRKQIVKCKCVSVLVAKSCPTLATPWTVVCKAPQSMGFSRQEYWSGLPFPSPGDLPDPGIEPGSLALQADFFTI